jgi:hypothetical protein
MILNLLYLLYLGHYHMEINVIDFYFEICHHFY